MHYKGLKEAYLTLEIMENVLIKFLHKPFLLLPGKFRK